MYIYIKARCKKNSNLTSIPKQLIPIALTLIEIKISTVYSIYCVTS